MSNDLEAKIVLLGAQGVGKTSLLNRYVHHTFTPTGIPSTVGASFLTKRLSHPPDHPDATIRLQLWDTAGQERFRSLARLFYRGAHAAVLCYAVTDARSFDEMGRWLHELRDVMGPACIVHVVGTKLDLVEADPLRREVPFERCVQYVAEHVQGGGSADASKRSSGLWGPDGAAWDCCHEISAKDGEGVEEVFRVISRKLVEQRRRMDELEALSSPESRYAEGSGYFDRGMESRGSFRVGVGDKRRSWLGFPGFPVGPGSPAALSSVQAEPTVQKRSGRCC